MGVALSGLMLVELDIRDFALIAAARVDFAEGLNVLSGETGVGKSLLVHALAFLVGGKASPQLLRSGAKEAEVCGTFVLPSRETARAVEAIVAVELDPDQQAGSASSPLLLRRAYSSAGVSRAYVNGRPAAVQQLREIGALLVDLHGQHEHQSLLSPSTQIDVLDRFSGAEAKREAYESRYRTLREDEARLAALRASAADRAGRLELLGHHAREIELAHPVPGETERLEAERVRLANLGRIAEAVASAYAELHEAEGAILGRLKRVERDLARVSDLDGALRPHAEALAEAGARISDAAFALGRYGGEADGEALVRVEERIDLLRGLLAKHGPTVEDLMRRKAEIDREIAELSGHQEETRGLEERLRTASKGLLEAGKSLSAARAKAAKRLADRVRGELADLGMAQARFEVEMTPAGAVEGPVASWALPSGLERIEFLIAPNPGEPRQPLRKIASGGELARVMLALKTILAEADRVPVLVFDEVDANVGGRLGRAIGEKLRAVASRRQVFCVTHLAPIAAFADRHVLVTKESGKGRTETRFRALEGDDRVEEIAEMVKGKPPTPTTRAQAREMLAEAAAHGRSSARKGAASPARRGAAPPTRKGAAGSAS